MEARIPIVEEELDKLTEDLMSQGWGEAYAAEWDSLNNRTAMVRFHLSYDEIIYFSWSFMTKFSTNLIMVIYIMIMIIGGGGRSIKENSNSRYWTWSWLHVVWARRSGRWIRSAHDASYWRDWVPSTRTNYMEWADARGTVASRRESSEEEGALSFFFLLLLQNKIVENSLIYCEIILFLIII